MNQCNFHGRLTADPELRYTNNGKAVCNFTLAVEDGYGKYKKVEYIKIIVWNKAGKAAAKYLSKGRQVIIENGTLRVRRVEKDGRTYTNPEVHARSVKYLTSDKVDKKEDKNKKEEPIKDDFDEEEPPF